MFCIRTRKVAVAALAGVVAIVASSCASTDAGTATPVGTSTDVAALLGPTNQATGSPIKIGLVDDGKSIGIDHTALVAAFNATVRYVNEHLGGINGHVVEVDECATNNVPSDATACGVKMANDGVAAVLVPVSAQDAAVVRALEGSGIPYFTYLAGGQEIMVKPNVTLLTNPVGLMSGPAKIAHDNGVKKAGIILIDVPASTGPVTAVAKPMYERKGIDVNIVSISPQTADMTPQIQQAISAGAEQFAVVGSDEFNTSAIKALKQLGFTGKIVLVTAPSKAMADNVPGGLEGVGYITSSTSDPSDVDVQRFNAVLQTYMKDVTPDSQSAWAYVTALGFVNALAGDASSVDAASITKALAAMPKPLPLPLGAGLTYQCGAKVVAILPPVCTANVLATTLDEHGQGGKYEILDVQDYLVFG